MVIFLWIWVILKTDEYSPRKKIKQFQHKRTFLSALAVMNKKFISNLVGRIWGSNLRQNSIDTTSWLFETGFSKKNVLAFLPRFFFL